LSGREAARFFSLIGLILMLAPAIAPSIGSFMLLQFQWQAIFLMLFCYAIVLAILLRLFVFTASRKRHLHHEAVSVWSRYRAVISTRPALRFLAVQTLCFSVMLVFISHASFIYQQHFGAAPTAFAFLFGANIIFMAIANLTNRRLLKSTDPKIILRWSVVVQAVGILMLLLVMCFAPVLWLFLPAMMVTIGAMGAITPNSLACFMEYFHQHGGTASAVYGAIQFSIGALIAMATTWLPETVIAVVLVQAACSLVALLLVWTGADGRTTRG